MEMMKASHRKQLSPLPKDDDPFEALKFSSDTINIPLDQVEGFMNLDGPSSAAASIGGSRNTDMYLIFSDPLLSGPGSPNYKQGDEPHPAGQHWAPNGPHELLARLAQLVRRAEAL